MNAISTMRFLTQNLKDESESDAEELMKSLREGYLENEFIKIVQKLNNIPNIQERVNILLENAVLFNSRPFKPFPDILGIESFPQTILQAIEFKHEFYNVMEIFLNLFVLNSNISLDFFIENNLIDNLFDLLPICDLSSFSIILNTLRMIAKRNKAATQRILNILNFDILTEICNNNNCVTDIICFVQTIANQDVPSDFKKDVVYFSMRILNMIYNNSPDKIQEPSEISLLMKTIILIIQDYPQRINETIDIAPLINLILEGNDKDLIYPCLLYLCFVVKHYKFDAISFLDNFETVDKNFDAINFEEIPKLMIVTEYGERCTISCCKIIYHLIERNIKTRISLDTMLQKVIPTIVFFCNEGFERVRIISYKILKLILNGRNGDYKRVLFDEFHLQNAIDTLETENEKLVKSILEFVYEYCKIVAMNGDLDNIRELLDTNEVHEIFDEKSEAKEAHELIQSILELCFPPE